jgi:hypothetical protein
MARFLILIVSLAASAGWAKSTVFPYPEKAGYLESSKNTAPELAEVDKFFAQNRYLQVKGQGLPTSPTLQWLDRIYMTRKTRQSVLVKARVKLVGKMEIGRIYKHQRGLLIHLKENNETVSAFFFVGYTAEAVESMASQLKKRVIADSGASIQSWLLPRAEAEEPATFGKLGLLCDAPNAGAAAATPSNVDLLQLASECAAGVGEGVKDVTVDIVPTVINGAQQIWNGTINGVVWWFTTNNQQKWDAVVKTQQEMMTVINNFPSIFQDGAAAWNMLPTSVQARVICEVITAVGLPTLVAVLTGGSTSAVVAAKIAQVIAKLGDTLKMPKLADLAASIGGHVRTPAFAGQAARFEGIIRTARIAGVIDALQQDEQKLRATVQRLEAHLREKSPAAGAALDAWKTDHAQIRQLLETQLRTARLNGNDLLRAVNETERAHKEMDPEQFEKYVGEKIVTMPWLCDSFDPANIQSSDQAPETQK